MANMEELFQWLNRSEEVFELAEVLSEDRTVSQYFSCEIMPVSEIVRICPCYDVVFMCGDMSLYETYMELLVKLGFSAETIKADFEVTKYLSPHLKMEYYAEKIKREHCNCYESENVEIGDFSYGYPDIQQYGGKLKIGKFCSFAPNVKIMLGGEHRTDWCTTYPFNALMPEFSYIDGHPFSKGDITIGNDVWIGSDVTILSGVTIGDGSVIAANACVTQNVEPYTIVGGIPAKPIKKRFCDEEIKRLLRIRWWDWKWEEIWQVIPVLQSNSLNELFDFYEEKVRVSGAHS
jgi:acetyltransferase-like isoleucine patch superfamily enzyme